MNSTFGSLPLLIRYDLPCHQFAFHDHVMFPDSRLDDGFNVLSVYRLQNLDTRWVVFCLVRLT